jgi:hypothetical protein
VAFGVPLFVQERIWRHIWLCERGHAGGTRQCLRREDGGDVGGICPRPLERGWNRVAPGVDGTPSVVSFFKNYVVGVGEVPSWIETMLGT